MSKLFKLKDWLTVKEAARHLSGIFEEEVTEADVLRLALDRHLKLSVLFPNGMHCRFGKLVPIADAEYEEVPSLTGSGLVKLYGGPVLQSGGRETHVLKLSDKIAEIRGLFDLPMIGGEELDIEHAYQQLIGGPEITRVAIDGVFVEGSDGMICQLCEHYDDNEWQIGSKRQLAKLEAFFSRGGSGLSKKKIEEGMQKYKQDREIFLKGMASRPETERYYPMGGLPQDVVWVVRTEILRQFEKSISNQSAPIVRDESLIAVIAALLAEWPKGKPPTGKDLEKAAQSVGIKVSDDTIRKALKSAREIAPSLPA